MKKDLLLKKLYLDDREFITASELSEYCTSLDLPPQNMIRNLLRDNRLVRIFKGIFYLRSPEEMELGRNTYNHLELVANGIQVKGVKNWYFGLYTALKLHNLTHEHFAVEYVINDHLFRAKPVTIAGHTFRFVKCKPALFGFGIAGEDIFYSDVEKTILDFIHLRRYNSVPEEKIVMELADYAENISRETIYRYAEHYSHSVKSTLAKVIQ